MKKLPYILLLLTLLPLMATECEEPNLEEPPLELPPITQQGANTFGCLINGEIFIAQRNFNGRPVKAQFQIIDLLTLKGVEDSGNHDATFNFAFIDRTGDYENKTFTLNDTSTTRLNFERAACEVDNYPDPSQVIAGQVTIDRLNLGSFVAGQFWFIAVTPECDTLRVTDGRFDVKLL